MTLEQALLAALGSVVSALCWIYKDNRNKDAAEIEELKKRSKDCESWRDQMQPIIQNMVERLGFASGIAQVINKCHVKGCPHAGNIDSTFSMQKPKPHEEPEEQ